MAWTAPRTWTDGELVTAAIMNPHVRDNQLAAGPHLIARKPSDESVANATLQDDDHLILPLAANAAWEFRLQLAVVSTAAADFKIAFNAPTGATLYCSFVWANTTGTATHFDLSSTTFPTGSASLYVPATTIGLQVPGTIVNGSTAGNLTLQWAQVATSGTTFVKANSALWGVQLA
jgi:hypothetical protein